MTSGMTSHIRKAARMRLIDADLFMQRIEPYNTLDKKDKALYNFALHEIVCMPTVDVLEQIRDEIQENINYNKKMNYQGIVAGLLLTLDIIDHYMKGE